MRTLRSHQTRARLRRRKLSRKRNPEHGVRFVRAVIGAPDIDRNYPCGGSAVSDPDTLYEQYGDHYKGRDLEAEIDDRGEDE